MSIAKSKILFNEPPLTVPPSLAVLIGLNEAIALQQLHYWLCNKNSGIEKDGHKWIFNTMEEWRDGNFPFWSTKTIARTWSSLASYGLVIIKQFDQKDRNMRNYYRIDYDRLNKLDEDNLSLSSRTKRHSASPQGVPLLNSNTETTIPEIKEEDGEQLKNIKPSLLLANISKVIDPMEHGVLTIQESFRKLSPFFILGWLAKVSHDRALKQPIGYLTNRLKGSEEPDQFYIKNFRKFLPDEFLEAVGLGDFICDECDAHFPERELLNKHYEKTHPVTDEDIPPIEISHALQDLKVTKALKSLKDQLRLQMPRENFVMYIKDMQALSYADEVLTLGVPDEESQAWLDSRLLSTIERLLIGVFGHKVAVRFEIMEMVES